MADNRLFRGGGTSNSRLRSKGIPRPQKTSLKILSEKSKSFGNGINSQQLNELIGSSDFHDFKRQKVIGNAPGIVPRIFTFNISWDLTNVPITAFGPSGYIVGNTQDRPRINTFLSDGTNLNFVSAGYIYQKALNGNPADFPAIAAPWGDPSTSPPLREKITQQVVFNDAPSGTFAGIDIFTANWMPTPVTIPNLTGWTKSSTGNPTEDKYQITFDSPGTYTIDIKLEPGDYSPGVAPSVSGGEFGSDFSTFTLTTTAGAAINESDAGDTEAINLIYVKLNTTNVPDGTVLPYTVTGIDSNDLIVGTQTVNGIPNVVLSDVTGNFIVGTTDELNFGLSADGVTEGPEVFSMSLDNGRSNTIEITINDTSTPIEYYTLQVPPTANEGDTIDVTLTTLNAPPGRLIPWKINKSTLSGQTNLDDFVGLASLSGNFVVPFTNSIITSSFTFAEDFVTEGTETMELSIGTNVENSVRVNVRDFCQVFDTSTALPDAYLLQANGGDSATINEGDTVRITLSTQNIADGTELPYTITGVSPIDINPPSLTGKFIIGSLSAVDIIATQDSTTEGTEVMNLALDNGRVNIDTTILDTSQSAPATFAISSNKASVIEGESFTITLNTTNVADGTSVLYDISGIDQSDISENLTGNFTVNSNTASQTFNIINDGSTEGNETLTFTLTDRTDELGSPIALTINIIDTGNTSLASFEYINSDFGNMFN